MASEHAGRRLTAHLSFTGSGRDHGDHTSGDISQRTFGRPWKARQGVRSATGNQPKDSTRRWVVIGQWTNFALGVFCIVCGVFGAFAHIEGPLSVSVAWLGSAYVPTLRITALLCLFMGLLLACRGWSSRDRKPERNQR
jgi:hypothetical protein